MKLSRFALLFVLALLLVVNVSASSPIAIESARTHSAAGAFGCTVTGVSTANPGVVTCSAAHGLIDGDQVQITAVGGATQANVTGYAKVTGASTTTFALYSDVALSTGVNVTGTYTSGGSVSIAKDVSGWTGAYFVTITVNSLTAAKNAVLAIQDSADGFASDIVTLWVVNVPGAVVAGAPVTYSVPSYMLPSARVGKTNGRLRLNVLSIDSAGSANVSFMVQ